MQLLQGNLRLHLTLRCWHMTQASTRASGVGPAAFGVWEGAGVGEGLWDVADAGEAGASCCAMAGRQRGERAGAQCEREKQPPEQVGQKGQVRLRECENKKWYKRKERNLDGLGQAIPIYFRCRKMSMEMVKETKVKTEETEDGRESTQQL